MARKPRTTVPVPMRVRGVTLAEIYDGEFYDNGTLREGTHFVIGDLSFTPRDARRLRAWLDRAIAWMEEREAEGE